MYKFTKHDIFWVIVLVVLSITLGVMIGNGLSSVALLIKTEENVEIPDSKMFLDGCLDDGIIERSVEKLIHLSLVGKDYITLKPLPVAEPLEGPELYRFCISQIHEQYYPEVDPYIALAVLEIESDYQPNLTSSAGAVGLMQWIPKWHAWRMEKFHLNDMWDPYTNIVVGMDCLNDLYSSTGSWREALYLYNHSTAYVDSVLSRADLLREGGWFG